MLRVGCKDIGVEGCDVVAEDREVRKVEEKSFDYLRERHPELITGLTVEQYRELEHKVKGAVRYA